MDRVYKATVRKIIDGDSLKLDVDLGFGLTLAGSDSRGISLRVAGIDTEDTRTRDLLQKKFGLNAKAFVVDFVPVGSTAILKTIKRDKYGRWLGDLKVGRKWLSKELLREHLCVVYNGENKADVKKAHLLNREILRKEGKVDF
mgnify:CR=1 FL=1